MADDLTRWLRAVRPATRADKDWAATTEADDALAAIHRASAPRSPAHAAARRRARVWLPVGVLGSAAAVVVVVTVSSSSAPQPSAIAPPHGLPSARPAAMTLQPYHSCSDLLRGLRRHTAAHTTAAGLPGSPNANFRAGRGPLDKTADPQASTAGAAGGTSTTNVQEAGVDEPDIVKTDDGRVITLTDGVLRVIDATSRSVLGSLDLTLYEGWQDAQLLVSGSHAVVFMGHRTDVMRPGFNYAEGAPAGASTADRAVALFVDLTGQPTVTGSLRADGGYLDARLVGGAIRLVVSSTPAIAFPNTASTTAQSAARNKAIVANAPLGAWLPNYTIVSGASTVTRHVPCNQVSHPSAYTGASMLTIYTLDLAHLAADPAPISVAADGDTVYATHTSLYVASNPDWLCCVASMGSQASPNRGPVPSPSSQRTEIHRFDISGSGRPAYLGSGSVPGRLLSRYSLSDYAGYLRIATTTGPGEPTQSNGVYVLAADTLKITGHLGGLGANEQLYAVRFIGPLAYIVTFRQTDPLYVIDLSDPADPRAIGSLRLTGYSDYLHDAGQGRLIGVGQQANSAGTVAGLQVSLFDVRQGSAPKRTGHVVLPDAPGEAPLDPHAFLYWEPTGLVVVPVQSWAQGQSGKVLVLQVRGHHLSKLGVLGNPTGRASDDGLGIQRSLLVDGALWTVSGSGVRVSDPTTLARLAWIAFS